MARRREAPSRPRTDKSATPAGRDQEEHGGRRILLWAAGITATGTLLAAVFGALIGLAKSPSAVTAPAIGAPTTTAPGTNLPPEPKLIPMATVSWSWIDESRIVVQGSLDKLGQPGEIYVMGYGPTSTTPNGALTQRRYFWGPVPVRPDGSWAAQLGIDPTATKELTISAFLLPPCDLQSISSPLCDALSRANPNSHPESPAPIPIQPVPSTPGNSDKPRLGPSRAPGPVVPPRIHEPGGIPGIGEGVVPRLSERSDVEQWLDRNTPNLAPPAPDPRTIQIPPR